mgnify:CR=1
MHSITIRPVTVPLTTNSVWVANVDELYRCAIREGYVECREYAVATCADKWCDGV